MTIARDCLYGPWGHVLVYEFGCGLIVEWIQKYIYSPCLFIVCFDSMRFAISLLVTTQTKDSRHGSFALIIYDIKAGGMVLDLAVTVNQDGRTASIQVNGIF